MIKDLSHSISGDMPVYPGTEPPMIIAACGFDDIGCLEHKMTMYSHTGTHIDAPAHLIEGSTTLDALSIDHFCGKSIVISVGNGIGRTISIENVKKLAQWISEVDFVLIHTGWNAYWGKKQYFFGFPVLSLEAAKWLSGFGLKGIGFDTISVDKVGTLDFPNHKVFLEKDTLIIENLTNLEKLPSGPFWFSCFPLKIAGADGSPIRAVAMIE